MNVQGAYALGRMELVTREAQQVDAELVDPRRNLADRLRRVRVKRHAVLARDAGAFPDRLNRSDLVVRMHDADQAGPRRDRAAQLVRLEPAGPVDGKPRDSHAEALEERARR